MNTVRFIIVEDEQLAANRLLELLKAYPFMQWQGSATTGEEGLALLEKTPVDLIFLDIEMPVMGGFEMLSKLKQVPKVVFVTAFEEYALKAFEENSMDYLLKPINPSRLEKTVQRIQESYSEEQIGLKELESALQQFRKRETWSSITVSKGNQMKILNLSSVLYFKAEQKYVIAVDREGEEYLLSKTLKLLEEKLPDHFLRIHKTFIINLNEVQSIKKNFRSLFVFKMNGLNATELTCGNSYLSIIKDRLQL